MGITERREREKTELRQRILDTARELFVKEGYESVSMRRIAEIIEYSPTAIYLHFKDKEALFAELCNQDFLSLARKFMGISQIADPIERLRQVGHAYLDFALEFPNHYRLMFMTPHECREIEGGVRKGNTEEDAYAFLKGSVEAALATGRFLPQLKDVELVAQTLWAGVHGVASLEIAKRTSDYWVDWRTVKQRAELMVDSLLRGLMKPVLEGND